MIERNDKMNITFFLVYLTLFVLLILAAGIVLTFIAILILFIESIEDKINKYKKEWLYGFNYN